MEFGSGITFAGLGSGIDSAALIQRLVQLEGLRKAQLQSKRDIQQTKLTAASKLQSLTEALRKSADGLSKTSSFLKLAGSVSREGVISAAVSSTATPGTHSIEVQQLAATDRWAFDAVADPATNLATGAGQAISFRIGTSTHTIAIDESASNLDQIAAAINAAAGTAVEASVVNVGTAAAPSWKLTLASKSSGEAGRIQDLQSTVGGLTIDGTPPAPGSSTPASANHLVVGLNAKALVNGLLVERDTNEFAGVIPGVTFTARSAAPGQPVDLTVAPDNAAITTALKGFVKAYNDVVNFVNQQNSYTEGSGAGGALFGDGSVSVVRTKIRSALFDVNVADVIADTEGYSTLGMVGLEVQKDGTIVVNETKLADKLTNNPNLLAGLFADDDGFVSGGALPGDPGYGVDQTPDSGLAATLVRAIDSMLRTGVGPGGTAVQGLFAAKKSSLQDTMRQLDERIAAEDVRLAKFEETLRIRFASLENLIGGLNSQSAALAALTG